MAQTSSKPLKVAIKPLEPFVMQAGDNYKGFSIELWQVLAERNGWQFEYVWHKTVKDLLKSVQTSAVDVGIAGISMTEKREEMLDFSLPMFNAGLQIMVPLRQGFSLQNTLESIFSPQLLVIVGLMLLTIALTGHAIWLIERRRDPTFPQTYFRGVWEGIWWAALNLATGGIGDKSPRSVIGRLTAMIWIFIGIVLLANFTAAVTANLTLREIRGNINGIGDLPGKRVVTVEGSTAADYLNQNNIRFTGVIQVDEAYALLESGKADALVYDSPVLLYHANALGKGRVRVIGAIFKQEYYGIAVPTGSPLREAINRTLIQVIGDGTFQQLYEKWFGGSS